MGIYGNQEPWGTFIALGFNEPVIEGSRTVFLQIRDGFRMKKVHLVPCHIDFVGLVLRDLRQIPSIAARPILEQVETIVCKGKQQCEACF